MQEKKPGTFDVNPERVQDWMDMLSRQDVSASMMLAVETTANRLIVIVSSDSSTGCMIAAGTLADVMAKDFIVPGEGCLMADHMPLMKDLPQETGTDPWPWQIAIPIELVVFVNRAEGPLAGGPGMVSVDLTTPENERRVVNKLMELALPDEIPTTMGELHRMMRACSEVNKLLDQLLTAHMFVRDDDDDMPDIPDTVEALLKLIGGLDEK